MPTMACDVGAAAAAPAHPKTSVKQLRTVAGDVVAAPFFAPPQFERSSTPTYMWALRSSKWQLRDLGHPGSKLLSEFGSPKSRQQSPRLKFWSLGIQRPPVSGILASHCSGSAHLHAYVMLMALRQHKDLLDFKLKF